MTRKRAHIKTKDRLAAALMSLPCVPEEIRNEARRRKLPAEAIIAAFELDHNILHAFDGSDEWWNLTWMIKAEHREKSRGDTTKAAKTKRISSAHSDHREKMARKLLPTAEPRQEQKTKWGSRKIQSRGFQNDRRHTVKTKKADKRKSLSQRW